MKTTHLLSTLVVASVTSLAALSAYAEEYQGVLEFESTRTRAEVRAETGAVARGPDLYAEGASAGVAARPSANDRATVRAQAVATAHAPNQNLKREAFVNSVVPSQYTNPAATTRQAAR